MLVLDVVVCSFETESCTPHEWRVPDTWLIDSVPDA